MYVIVRKRFQDNLLRQMFLSTWTEYFILEVRDDIQNEHELWYNIGEIINLVD